MKKNALITGATSGIGYELARILAKNDYNLVLVARNEEKLNKVKNEIEKKNKVNVGTIQKNLSNPKSCDDIFQALKQRKIRIDLLVNNAGFGNYGTFLKSNWKKEFDMIQTNIISLTYLTKLFSAEMVKYGGGQILNVAAMSAVNPNPFMSVYCATKAYVFSFSRSITRELKDHNIKVTTLCPGPTKTAFQKKAGINNTPKNLPSAEAVAEYAYRSLLKGKRTAVYGLSNKFFMFLSKFLPQSFIASINYEANNDNK